jgi:hypothetical protein
LHAKGWTREAAIQYLVDNTAMDEQLCEDQVLKKNYLISKTMPRSQIDYDPHKHSLSSVVVYSKFICRK